MKLTATKNIKCTGCDFIYTRHIFIENKNNNSQLELNERLLKPYTCRICKKK